MFGFEKTLEHLDGHAVNLERNEVTQPEFVDEIYGEGMPIVDEDGETTSRRGNLFVRYIVRLPEVAPTGTAKTNLENIIRPTPDYEEL